MNSTVKYVCPLIVVADMQRARNFYEKLLGQEVIVDFGENITFRGNFALHLQKHYRSLIDGKEVHPGGNDFELYFEYDEVEELACRLKDAGVVFVHEMREQPWRQRVVRFYDPDCHIVEVGESLEFLAFRLYNEGCPAEKISHDILMPLEFVEAGIKKYKQEQ